MSKKNPVAFEGVCRVVPDRKRPYMPGIVAETKCDGCGARRLMHFGSTYPSQYIEAGKPFEFNMYCPSCDHDNMRSGVMLVEVRVEPACDPKHAALMRAAASCLWDEMWEACTEAGWSVYCDQYKEWVQVAVDGFSAVDYYCANTSRSSALQGAMLDLLGQLEG